LAASLRERAQRAEILDYNFRHEYEYYSILGARRG
jgi:hypothetical protein